MTSIALYPHDIKVIPIKMWEKWVYTDMTLTIVKIKSVAAKKSTMISRNANSGNLLIGRIISKTLCTGQHTISITPKSLLSWSSV